MAAPDEPPHKLYRAMVAQSLFRYAPPLGIDPEVALRVHLAKSYTDTSAALVEAIAGNAPPQQIRALRNGLFVFAAGLFAFGRSDVAENLIEHLPPSGSVRRLA